MVTMEERAAIPVERPVPHPTIPLWQDPPSDLAHYGASSQPPSRADVVIIGSGVTGASIAYELLSNEHPSRHRHSAAGEAKTWQPSVANPGTVIMLEARTACSGATGRNGGHTKHATYRSFPRNDQSLGAKEAAKAARYEYDCMRAVHDFAREHQIECDSWQGDTVDVMYDERQFKAAKDAISRMREVLGTDDPVAKYEIWEAAEVEAKFGSVASHGAVSYEAGSLSAYKFCIGTLKLAIDKGLKFYTETPALKLEKDNSGGFWKVETHKGMIFTKMVVLATNGYSAAIYPRLQGVIVPLRGQITAQRRGSNMTKADPPTTYSFIQEDGYEYMVQRPLQSMYGGDIVIGGGLTSGSERGLYEYGTVEDGEVDDEIMTYLTNCTAQYFGDNWGKDHADGRVRKSWTGIMGYTGDGFPFVGPVPKEQGLYIAAAFQGHGMVLCVLAARAVAAMMRNEEHNAQIDLWFPKSFRLTDERFGVKFRGRLSTRPNRRELRHIG